MILIFLTAFFGSLKAQTLTGRVYFLENGKNIPLEGAGIYWKDADSIATTSDSLGRFRLPHFNGALIISFVGFAADTLQVHAEERYVEIVLGTDPTLLKGVTIVGETGGRRMNQLDALNVEAIGRKELLRAACCNLSESFETNPSVDVAYSDAVTGAKQIRMLGIDGKYVQLMTELLPFNRGLAASYGLSFVPGPWIKGLQITKGPASVVNGPEGIAGQINVELLEPSDDEKNLVNLYAGSGGRVEANTALQWEPREGYHFLLLGHGSVTPLMLDENGNGFADQLKGNTFSLMGRAAHQGKRTEQQAGLQWLKDSRRGGQIERDPITGTQYIADVQTERWMGWAKFGILYPDKPFQSIGNIGQVTRHTQNSQFGTTVFDAGQTSVHLTSIFASIISHTAHQWKAGYSLDYDRWKRHFVREQLLDRDDQFITPGAFAEYQWQPDSSFSLLAGVRADLWMPENQLQASPRIHLRWAPSKNWTLRAQGGLASRRPEIFSENAALWVSSRTPVITDTNTIERAITMGGSIYRNLKIRGKNAYASAEVYHTTFINGVIADYDSHPGLIILTASGMPNTALTSQAELNFQPWKGLSFTTAYRGTFPEVQTGGIVQRKALTPQTKLLLTGSQSIRHDKFIADFTAVRYGQARVPTAMLRDGFQSKPYWILNAQIMRKWRATTLAFGGENLLNFRQPNPILGADNPFGPGFDGSLLYGPLMGIRLYANLNFNF